MKALIIILGILFSAFPAPGSTGRPPGLPVNCPERNPRPEGRFFGFIHLVREGETLETIIRMYRVDRDELRHLNGFHLDFPLIPGTSVKVPAENQ